MHLVFGTGIFLQKNMDGEVASWQRQVDGSWWEEDNSPKSPDRTCKMKDWVKSVIREQVEQKPIEEDCDCGCWTTRTLKRKWWMYAKEMKQELTHALCLSRPESTQMFDSLHEFTPVCMSTTVSTRYTSIWSWGTSLSQFSWLTTLITNPCILPA